MIDPREDDLAPDTDDSSDAESIAIQQFGHALLRTLEEDPPANQERVRRLMDRIETSEVGTYESTWRVSRTWRFASGIAAAILLAFALIFLNGTQRSATATVYDSIDAMRLAGDRTYSVSFAHAPDTSFERAPEARLDVRSDDQYVFRTRTPEGHMLVAGVDDDGEWMLRRDGVISRTTPEHHRPRWVDLAGGSLLLASIDGLLASLSNTYELELLQPELLSTEDPLACDRVRALPRDATLPGPEEIDLWIDPETRLLRRIDLVLGSPDARPGPGRPHMPEPPRFDPARPKQLPPPFGRDRPNALRPGGPPKHRPHAVRFELDRQEPLPANWFEPEAHAQPLPPA